MVDNKVNNQCVGYTTWAVGGRGARDLQEIFIINNKHARMPAALTDFYPFF